jgi:glutamine cyclotransferase
MESNYFGEGLTLFDNDTKLIQLTYKENTGFVYDSISLEILQTFQYETTTHEGWGITYDDSTNTLYVSDGSEWISLWHPETRKEQRRMRVTYDGEPLQFLNELEFIHGNHKRILLANVFTTDAIVGINPDTGVVEILYDFTALWPYHDRSHYPHVDVFNGISHADIANEIIITGKFWPYMYRVKLLV